MGVPPGGRLAPLWPRVLRHHDAPAGCDGEITSKGDYLFLRRSLTARETRLTFPEHLARTTDTSPTLSPDGRRLAFVRVEDHGGRGDANQTFRLVALDLASRRRRTLLAGRLTAARWTRQRDLIAVSAVAGGRLYAQLLDLRTRRRTTVLDAPAREPYVLPAPSFAPDGHRGVVAVQASPEEFSGRLFAFDTATRRIRVLGEGSWPRYDRRGRRILFCSDRDKVHPRAYANEAGSGTFYDALTYTMRPDGTDIRRLRPDRTCDDISVNRWLRRGRGATTRMKSRRSS